ncbi:tetratricopeptide repeat protein [Pseudoalteromonas sp. MMG012]|uniref:tetratricopeptide repeat protein n=1 Tax=Pseudoalteromonas sp. MMG012 TaxID=2822686 RepID=UPI001B39E7B6|nr:tetratricopeptide repeat protein [Pseudoalteromonas sp. MMG012]MBQ4850289.1 tetratricopeptide repeat protein [Pseudoalteromonas sp. MMG012]
MVLRAFFIIVFLLTMFVNASQSGIDSLLDEAEDYLVVKPSRTLTLLNQVNNLASYTDNTQIRWHLLKLRASVSTNRLVEMDSSIEQLQSYQHSAYFKDNLVTIFSAIGIWFRRSGFPQYANASLSCALTYAKNPKQRLALINSKALVARYLKKYRRAEVLYEQATSIATKHNNKIKLATIANNLGVIALDKKEYERAEHYFRRALKGHQNNDNRAGNVTAGLNLLFLFTLQNQVVNYQRLYEPIAALTNAFPNKAKQALLFWIRTMHNAKGQPVTDNRLKVRLANEFSMLESRRVKQLVKFYFAEKLAVEVSLTPTPKPRKINLSLITNMSHCDWKSALQNDK